MLEFEAPTHVLSLLVLVALAACARPAPESQAAPAPPSPAQTYSLSEGSGEASFDGDLYSYTPVGRRDPFRALNEATEKLRPNATELERWEIDQLKLIAVLLGPTLPYAMLEDVNGKGHVVRFGT